MEGLRKGVVCPTTLVATVRRIICSGHTTMVSQTHTHTHTQLAIEHKFSYYLPVKVMASRAASVAVEAGS